MASVQAAPGATATSISHPYTCNTCQVAYRNIDLQKGHMKSDWHRYNLKRRVASLPPISADVFTDKVLQARAASDAQAGKAYFERSCSICDKTYYSENAYQNHLSSQKHKLNESASESVADPRPDDATSVISSTFSLGQPVPVPRAHAESDSEDDVIPQMVSEARAQKDAETQPTASTPAPEASVDSPATNNHADTEAANPEQTAEERERSLKLCLFCSYESPTVPLNTLHMERFHGMFIPEKPYLVDLDGLIGHLQKRVCEHHQCIFCGKIKSTAFAVQTHMRDTGHCKIPFSTEEEQLDIGDFYDFRSTYSDGHASDTDSVDGGQGGASLSGRRLNKADGDLGEDALDGADNAEDGWETDSSASSLDSADLTAVPAEGHIHQFERLSKHKHHSRHDPRQRHQADGWHSHAHKHAHAVFYDDYELHLPSGKSVGHRSLNKYFRQNLHNYPSAEEQAERKALGSSEDSEEGAVIRGRASGREMVPRGAAGLIGVSDEKKLRVRRAEHRGRNAETAHIKRNDMAYGKKLNNQKTYYYRYQAGG
ncbi:zinc finger protein [Stachybotrys elegans]|uniref:Zinc finger protein n=1 Tax=Stachybotrys elegans TaxID=80388 RepID=A0A8K0SLZ3_9HYPO|nr:zinc finger protein [Stachybotrys elegans]